MAKRLVKSQDKKLFGVAGGVAEYFDIDPTIVRGITSTATQRSISRKPARSRARSALGSPVGTIRISTR